MLPVLKQINQLLAKVDLNFQRLASFIASNLPQELERARTFSSDFYLYARENPVIIEFILRKAAHIVVFFIITLAIFLLLREYTRKPYLAVIGALLLGSVVAFLDEYHQSMVDGRHGTFVDVFINMVGIFLAGILLVLSHFLTSSWRR